MYFSVDGYIACTTRTVLEQPNDSTEPGYNTVLTGCAPSATAAVGAGVGGSVGFAVGGNVGDAEGDSVGGGVGGGGSNIPGISTSAY